MAGVRVDPAEVGPRLAAALSAAAAALSAPAAIPPPLPPGSDPVSVAATNRVAVNAAKLSSQLAAGIPRLSEGGQAVTAALTGYVVTDAEGAANVGGQGTPAAAAAAVTPSDIPAPPAVTIPDLPFDMPAALATVPAEPDMVDLALRSGAGESGLEPHATGWDTAATNLTQAAQSLQQIAGGLPASWQGQDAEALSVKLQDFGRWMENSATAAGAQANSARQVASHWSTAVADHPRAEDYEQTRQLFLAAAARANAGDPRGASEAAQHEGEMTQMKEVSAKTMTTFGQGAGGTNEDVNHPGDSPRIGGDGDPHLPHQGAKELGTVDDPLSQAADPTGQGDPANQTGQLAGQMMQTLMSIPTQVASAIGQSLGQVGQQIQQAGQQATQAASQAASQLGNAMGGSPSSGAGGGSPRNPLSKLGSGGDPLGGLGGGGGAGGGRTMPAGLPEQAAPPAPAPPPASTTAVPTTAVPRGGGTPMGGGMMPMGMMPHGNKGADGKEIDRNPEWFPDEPLVKDNVEVSEPIAGQRKRSRPTET